MDGWLHTGVGNEKWVSCNLGELFIEAVEQLLLSLGLAHQRRHFFLQMTDYVCMNFGSPRALHKFVDLAFQTSKDRYHTSKPEIAKLFSDYGDVSHPTITSFLRDVVQVGEQVILFFLEQLHAQWASRCLPDRLVVE